VRDNCDIICVFTGLSTNQIDELFQMVNIPNLNKKEFINIYHKATEGSRNFLFINKTSKELRKNLNEKIIVE
jgi:hypothetical protein